MITTTQRRVLKTVLLESLHRYREFGESLESDYLTAMSDYPNYLRAMADYFEGSSSELAVQEKAGLSGYSDWAKTYDTETKNPVIAGESLVFDQLIAGMPKVTVLDVGAGTGRHAIPFARMGSHVTAVEPNLEMLSKAKNKAQDEDLEIEFLQREIYAPMEDDRDFDLVLCCLVLSHVEDLSRAMAALSERVSDKGRLICLHNMLAWREIAA